MKCVLVRMKETKSLVGVFTYNNAEELFWLIDEVTDPNVVEVKFIKTGVGVVWEDPKAQIVGHFEDDDADINLDGASFTSVLNNIAFFDDSEWSGIKA